MLKHKFIAPSINIETLDLEFEGLPIVTPKNSSAIDTILANSFGFGGTNASLLFRAFRQ
jgi:3-oxoacyl-[acyl-carrier-protein] synthase-1